MQSIALGLAIVSTVAYHLITKLIPAGAHPVAMLLTAYLFGSILCLGILVATPAESGFRGHFTGVNWTAPALAVAVVLLDIGFILLYRSGFPVSIGALVTQVAAALALLGLGILFFKDRLTADQHRGRRSVPGGAMARESRLRRRGRRRIHEPAASRDRAAAVLGGCRPVRRARGAGHLRRQGTAADDHVDAGSCLRASRLRGRQGRRPVRRDRAAGLSSRQSGMPRVRAATRTPCNRR